MPRLDTKPNKKAFKVVLLSAAIALLPIAALALRKPRYPITFSSESREVMERSILKVAPVGSSAKHIDEVLVQNGFSCYKRSANLMEYNQIEEWWWGLEWLVDVRLKGGKVVDVDISFYSSD
jgi:hypothetical protein